MTKVTGYTLCQGHNAAGSPCGAPALTDGSGFCCWHAKHISDRVKTAWARKGAETALARRTEVLAPRKRRRHRTLRDIRRSMEEEVQDLRDAGASSGAVIYSLRTLAEVDSMLARRQAADVAHPITVNVIRFDGEDNGHEATPGPPLEVSPRPRGIASEQRTLPQPLALSGDPDAE